MDVEKIIKEKILSERNIILRYANVINKSHAINSNIQLTWDKVETFINKYGNRFYKILYYLGEANKLSWSDYHSLGKMFSIMINYVKNDYYAGYYIMELARICFVKSFNTCPFKSRHKIALSMEQVLNVSYTNCKLKNLKFSTSYIFDNTIDVDFSNLPKECEDLCKICICNTAYCAYAFQLYICKHLVHYEKLCQHLSLDININTYQEKILFLEEKLKPFIKDIKFIKHFVLEFWNCYNNDDDIALKAAIEKKHMSDDIIFKTNNKNQTINYICISEEETKAINEDLLKWEMTELHKNDMVFNENTNTGRYAGSYAQDIMGYTDDDIDIIFDGDPEAYWNID